MDRICQPLPHYPTPLHPSRPRIIGQCPNFLTLLSDDDERFFNDVTYYPCAESFGHKCRLYSC